MTDQEAAFEFAKQVAIKIDRINVLENALKETEVALEMAKKDNRIRELEYVLMDFADIGYAALTPSGEAQSWEYMSSILVHVANRSREALKVQE